MATANTVNSFLNFTLSNTYQSDSNPLFTFPSANQNFSRSKLDFTIAVPEHVVLASSKIFNTASPIEKANAQIDIKDRAIFSPLLLSGSQVIADFSGGVRQGVSAYHGIYGTENPAALEALDFTTGFNVVSGGMNVKDAINEIKTAEKISDTVGKTLGNIKMASGAAQAVGGAAYIPVPALSIAALTTSSKIISTIAGVLGGFGNACFNLFSILSAIGTGIRLHEQRLFRNELDAILKDPNFTEAERPVKALEHLQQLAAVSPSEKEEIRIEIEALPEFGTLSSLQITEKIEERAKLLLLKKEATLKRLLSEDCLTQIRQKRPSDANSVIEAVQKKSKENVIFASITMGLLIAGLAVTITSFIFTSFIGIIATTALGLAISLSWLLIDGYDLIKEFKSTDPGRFDKLLMFISSVVAIVAVALVFFLSGGIAPMIIAGVVGAVWFAINVACCYRLYLLQKAKLATT